MNDKKHDIRAEIKSIDTEIKSLNIRLRAFENLKEDNIYDHTKNKWKTYDSLHRELHVLEQYKKQLYAELEELYKK
jgi:predicted  nucleic acid-binding Zn-ribbon protein